VVLLLLELPTTDGGDPETPDARRNSGCRRLWHRTSRTCYLRSWPEKKQYPATWSRGRTFAATAKQSHVQTGCASAVAPRASPGIDVANFPGRILAQTVCQCIHDVIEGRDFFDPYAADAMSMRALFAIGAIEIYFRDEKPSEAVSLIPQFGNIPAGEAREFAGTRRWRLVPLHKPHSSAKAFRYRKAVV
jgi:hypothetical protein